MTLGNQIRSMLRFPFEVTCILYMLLIFGYESTNRMFKYEKVYQKEKEKMLKEELNASSTEK